MHREVSASIEFDVTNPALIALAVAVAGVPTTESLTVVSDGTPVPVREHRAPHGARMHVVDAPTGALTIDYRATTDDPMPLPPTDELDLLTYLRPSRYCPSDRLFGTAISEFGHIDIHDAAARVAAVRDWVNRRLSYVMGSSGPTDDAVDTLLLGEGVCRDYAHLVIGLLRALDVPARLVAVYAPGLSPMDFHAVVEAWVEGAWRVVDATGLAPRASMLPISVGRDATDTAFASVHHGTADLTTLSVLAVVDELPGPDDGSAVVALS